jgi:integrase
MGCVDMTKIQLKYVHAFRDRHGKLRHYFRRPGFKQIPLRGALGSPEFMAAYAALAGNEIERRLIGASRTQPGTVNAAVISYFNSAAFATLANESRRSRRFILEAFRREHGDKRIDTLKRRNVDQMVAAKATTPYAAQNFLNALRALISHCMMVGLCADDPTQGVKRIPIKSAGHRTWTESDIAAYQTKHPIGSRARLAHDLLLYTAQRRADIVTMGWQHLRGGLIHVRQQKTGTSLAIPLHPALAEVLNATPSAHLTFLVNAAGKPFSPENFTRWFRQKCDEAGLPLGLSAHGLRKAACRRLAEAGCSANVIAAISGHTSLREVQRYTAAADQARMARSAMDTVIAAFPKTRTSNGKPE